MNQTHSKVTTCNNLGTNSDLLVWGLHGNTPQLEHRCYKCFLSPNRTGKDSFLPRPSVVVKGRVSFLAHAEDLAFFCISSRCPISWVLVASLCCSRSAWPLVTPQHSGVDRDGHLGRPDAGITFSQYSRRDLEEIQTRVGYQRRESPNNYFPKISP